MSEPDFYLKLGDTSSVITSTVQNSGGTPVDIQNATVRWKLAPIGGGTVEIDTAATNAQTGAGSTSNASTGDVSYNWGTVPSSAGRFLGEWEVTYLGGAVQTFPNADYITVEVLEDIR